MHPALLCRALPAPTGLKASQNVADGSALCLCKMPSWMQVRTLWDCRLCWGGTGTVTGLEKRNTYGHRTDDTRMGTAQSILPLISVQDTECSTISLIRNTDSRTMPGWGVISMVCKGVLSFPSSCDLLNSPPPVCSFPYDGRNQAEQILIKAVCTWLRSAVSQQHEGGKCGTTPLCSSNRERRGSRSRAVLVTTLQCRTGGPFLLGSLRDAPGSHPPPQMVTTSQLKLKGFADIELPAGAHKA